MASRSSLEATFFQVPAPVAHCAGFPVGWPAAEPGPPTTLGIASRAAQNRADTTEGIEANPTLFCEGKPSTAISLGIAHPGPSLGVGSWSAIAWTLLPGDRSRV
jgi:hypothetical protein